MVLSQVVVLSSDHKLVRLRVPVLLLSLVLGKLILGVVPVVMMMVMMEVFRIVELMIF